MAEPIDQKSALNDRDWQLLTKVGFHLADHKEGLIEISFYGMARLLDAARSEGLPPPGGGGGDKGDERPEPAREGRPNTLPAEASNAGKRR